MIVKYWNLEAFKALLHQIPQTFEALFEGTVATLNTDMKQL